MGNYINVVVYLSVCLSVHLKNNHYGTVCGKCVLLFHTYNIFGTFFKFEKNTRSDVFSNLQYCKLHMLMFVTTEPSLTLQRDAGPGKGLALNPFSFSTLTKPFGTTLFDYQITPRPLFNYYHPPTPYII